MTRYAIPILLAATMTLACDDGTPTAPSLPPSSAPAQSPVPAPQDREFNVSGSVREADGRAVGGASVQLTFLDRRIEARTDAAGAFTLVFQGPDFLDGVRINAARDTAYERTERLVSLVQTPSPMIRLHRIIRLSAGESLRSTIDSEDSLCGLDDEWFCRRVRVVGRQDAIVTIELIADAPAGLVLSLANDYYNTCCSTRTTAPIGPDQELVVDVLRPWAGPPGVQAFTLRTSVAP